MKKIALIAILLGFAGFSLSAQTTPAKTGKKNEPAKATATTKPAATASAAAPTKAATATQATTPTKKDGTPDMRYKANKDAAKTPPQHLKKDGTPDQRYKENKDKAKKNG